MSEPRSRYAVGNPSEKVSRLPKGSRIKRPYTILHAEETRALRQHYDPSLILLLEMVRLAGLRWVKRRDGWLVLNREVLEAIGLTDRWIRRRAVQRLLTFGWLEVRRTAMGCQLEYRLNPDWAKSSAEVIDLASRRIGKGGNDGRTGTLD